MPGRQKKGSARPPPQRPQSSFVPDSQPTEETFLQELTWCLDRLEAQMNQQNLPPRQIAEATRAWKTLSNPHTALVKKRQMMRMMFGDYRATMEQEAKQYSIRPQGMTITNVSSSKKPKSKYLKNSSYCASSIMDSTTKDFQFGFTISDQDQASSSDAVAPAASDAVAENYYLMNHNVDKTNPFTFNFDTETGDAGS